jgi:DNA replication protein DnaC
METHLIRSKSLNNIPKLKLQSEIANVLAQCSVCSKHKIEIGDEIDGVCPDCSVAIIAYNRYAEANIPLQYWHLKMEKDFTGDPNLLKKYNEIVSSLREHFHKGTSVCFVGNHGVGKSFTTACILKKAAQHGYSCLYSTLSDVVDILIRADDRYIARRELLMVNYLLIDELDPRFFSASEGATDLYARTLEGVFRTRAQNLLPTFICSNSPNVLESFTGSLKQSISSLFKGYMQTCIVLGEDHRSKQQK